MKLSKREKEVLKLISEGKTAKEIGKELGITNRTVQAHTANMLRSTGANNSAQLVAMWYQEKTDIETLNQWTIIRQDGNTELRKT